MICVTISFWLASAVRYGTISMGFGSQYNTFYFVVFLVCCALFNIPLNFNKDFMSRGYLKEFQAVIFYNVLLFLILITVAFLLHQTNDMSRIAIGVFFVSDFCFMYASRSVLKHWVRTYYQKGTVATRIIIIAENENMDQVLEQFKSGTGHKVVGVIFLHDEKAYGNVSHNEVNTTIDNLVNSLVQLPFDEVFIDAPNYSVTRVKRLINDFEDMGILLYYAMEYPDIGSSYSRIGIYGGFPCLIYSYQEPSTVALTVKRFFDILGSLIGLLLCAVIFVIFAPIIKADSPGPVIYSQIRIGKNGRRFRIYKFRSMYVDAAERLKDLQDKNEMEGPMFKMEDDPRITRIGKFMRKTSLDEFPQFFNVLKGDMSLVGTRPPTEDEFNHYNEHYRRRLSMRPGITGLWQVTGRSDITKFDDVVKLDLQYIDNWSLDLDLKLLFKTVYVVFSRKGAK